MQGVFVLFAMSDILNRMGLAKSQLRTIKFQIS